MNLTVFQSDKGDCLLLTGTDGRTMLIDGGMQSSYEKYVRPDLGQRREEGESIDLVNVSHIDQDHISGVLQMLDDEVAWRVYDYHHDSPHGNSNWKKPNFRRPPQIGAIWHNAFHDQVGKNRGQIEDMLATSAQFLTAGQAGKFENLAEQYKDLVSSERQAIRLSRRINTEQLNIPLNPHFDGKLALVREDQSSVSLGGMQIFVIGPFSNDLKRLRDKWNAWLKKNRAAVRKLRRKAREDERLLSQADFDELSKIGLIAAGGLGDRGEVTQPNLASLMLLVEEAGKTVLLTGDGHGDDILRGLKHYDKLNTHGGIHVDVLKVQHHGSEHNADETFAKLVTADHYVFCGNGAHDNPDLRIVDAFVRSRIGSGEERSQNPEVNRSFKLWFNSTSTIPGAETAHAAHVKRLEDRVEDHRQNSNDKLSYTFFESAKADISI